MAASRIILVAAIAAFLQSTTSAAEIYYKPGKWVALTPEQTGHGANQPGTFTIAEDDAASIQFALPMSPAWSRPGVSLQPVQSDAWLSAELAATGRIASRDGILRALPPGSVLTTLDLSRGAPDSLDLAIIYDFAESRLQPTERAALYDFVRRGGAVFFIFSSRAIPASSIEIWRELFGAHGEAARQEPALPRGFLVPHDFAVRMDIPDAPRLAWKQSGRGVVLAYGLAPAERLIGDAVGTAELFARAVRHIIAARRPISLGPVEPEAFRLFDEPGWSTRARRRVALLVGGYVLAAIGLVASFWAVVRKRGAFFIGSTAVIAALGIVAVIVMPHNSGIALDTASFLINDDAPALVSVGRFARLGPGEPPQLYSSGAMPPKILLYGRYSAAQREWAVYRFTRRGASIQPLLDIGQSVCFYELHQVRPDYASGFPRAEPPPNSARIIAFFERRLAKGVKHEYSWCEHPAVFFDSGAFLDLTQMQGAPMLVATPAR